MMRIALLVTSLWLLTSNLHAKIAFDSNRSGNHQIYTMDSNGGNIKRITHHEGRDLEPAWSPNGRQIAFHSYRIGKKRSEIYVIDADGTNERNLTNHPASDWAPAWSPDGSHIVFESDRDEKENLNLFIMEADGRNVRRLTDMEFASRPAWSPDGNWILFEAHLDQNDLSRQIYVIRPDGTRMKQISQPTHRQKVSAVWSPDGKRILYMETENFQTDGFFPMIASVPNPGNKTVQAEPIPIPLEHFDTIDFSTDGESVLFTGKEDNHWNIYRFQLADSKLIQLTDNVNSFTDAAPHEWYSRLSVSAQEGTPTLWGAIKSKLFSSF